MAKKKLNAIIPLVIYPFDVMVSFGQSDKEFKKYLSAKGVEWNDIFIMDGQGKYVMTNRNQSIIRLWNYPDEPELYGTLQHEIFHCVTMILDKVGMKFDLQSSDEAYAYLIGYLTTEIYKLIK